MVDSTIVKVALFFYILFAGVSLFLLWNNSAAPDALKNVGILAASILPVLIVVLPYLNPEKIERHFNFVLFYDNKEKSITSGEKWNPYSSSYMEMFTNLSQIPTALEAKSFSEFMGPKGLNIIEKGIIEKMLLKFSTHWDIEAKQFEGPTSSSESWGSNSDLKAKSIPINEIQGIFQDNPLLVKEGVLVTPQMYVPLGCAIKVESKDNLRSIIFYNPYVILKIAFRASSAMVAPQGIWGVLKSDITDMHRYYVIEYKVDTVLLINRTKNYSPEMKSYKKWFENICDLLSRYDWNIVDKKIEKSLNRETISKILEIK